MYNRYLAAAEADEAPPLHKEPPSGQTPADRSRSGASSQTASVFTDLSRGLSGRLQNIKLDMDTIIVLVIVWFLLKDGEEIDWEQLLLIGALLILGI